MSDERVVTELVIVGAQQAVREILSVSSATTGLVTVQESAGVRQRNIYDTVAAAAQAAATAQAEAAKRAADAIQKAEETSTRIVVQQAAARANARRNEAVTANANVAAARNSVGAGSPASLGGLTSRITAAANAQIAEQANVANTATEAHVRKTSAIKAQGEAEQEGARKGITYLSVLSAIHAASFLASNRTFTLVGSFVTLGLAFSKLGPVAAGVGLVFGGFLAVFGQVTQAMQLIQNVILGTIGAFGAIAGAVTTAAAAAGAAGVSIAANFETQLASVRAFGGATAEQLQQVSDQAGQLARSFGVSASSVVEATTLFARAGGTVQEAIDGATAAIVKLQLASAGELTAAQAAIAVSAALKQFSLSGAEAGRVVDNLTAAAQASALSFLGVQQAFIQAAPGAKTLGITIEDLSAGIALLGDQLVKGTITGTAFKQFMLDLINPSKQAQTILAQYGISIQDANGNIRPLVDVLGDLNKALGDQAVEAGAVTEAERARAIAVIFGSRAALAANILTREGAKGLQDYRDKLESVSSTNIVSVLLLPLNKQFEILQTNVQELGRVFGGPLLEPIRSVTVAAIGFVQGLIPLVETLGQTIAVVVTGQGFGALQQKIQELTGNDKATIFFTQLINVFRNVRDIIVSQIVPAIQDFITTVSSIGNQNGKLGETVSAFEAVNRAIQTVGAGIAILIRNFGVLVTEIVNNTGKGKELRDTLSNLATVIITRVVTGFAITAAGIALALFIMDKIGNVIRTQILPNLKTLGQALVALGTISNALVDVLFGPFEALIGGIITAQQLTKGLDLDTAIQGGIDAAKRARGPLGAVNDRLIQTGKALQDIATTGTEGFSSLDEILSGARNAANETVKSFQDLTGEIPDALKNLQAEIDQAQREAVGTQPSGTTGFTPTIVDPKAIESAKKRIEEAERDLLRRIENIGEDSGRQITNVLERTVERMGDIFDKATVQLEKLKKDTQDKVQEIFTAISQRRNDRARTDAVKRAADEELRIRQAMFDGIAREEEKALETTRTIRQRQSEDAQKQFEQQVSDAEDAYKRIQDAAATTFQAAQKEQERAFSEQQDAQTAALKAQLDAEKQARDDKQKLADAKTPEDRAKVQADIARAKADTQFQAQQQAQLTALAQRQEKEKAAFALSQELAATKFKQGQEDAFKKVRLDNEKEILLQRRIAEDRERTIREQEDNAALQRAEARATQLREFREQQELQLRNFQDRLENEAAQRQVNKIIREANERRDEIINEANRQAGELIQQSEQQILEQSRATAAQLRNVRQTFEDMKDSIDPAVLSSVLDTLGKAEQAVLQGTTDVQARLAAQREAALTAIQQRAAVGSAELTIKAPTEQSLQQQIPTQVIAAQTILANSLILPPGFSQAVSQAMLFGFRQAAQEGLLTPNSDSTAETLLPPLLDLNKALSGFFR